MVQSTDRYGVDVGCIRTDDLDKKVILDVAQQIQSGLVPTVLDLGCGGGGLSKNLVASGAYVIGIDKGTTTITALTQESAPYSQFSYIQGDMRDIGTLLGEQLFDICILQRSIHYLPYRDAQTLLCDVHERTQKTLYISISGLESDIGKNYVAQDTHVSERFHLLNETDAEKFSIYEPICLYTPEECIQLLLESGWNIVECWISAFGNTKIVCTH